MPREAFPPVSLCHPWVAPHVLWADRPCLARVVGAEGIDDIDRENKLAPAIVGGPNSLHMASGSNDCRSSHRTLRKLCSAYCNSCTAKEAYWKGLLVDLPNDVRQASAWLSPRHQEQDESSPTGLL